MTTTEDTTARPTTVCICGSTRFMAEILEAAREESVKGNIVTLPLCDLKTPDPLWPTQADVEGLKAELDELHRAKIRASDAVLVVCPSTMDMPEGYIGESTRSEIAYATAQGKAVHYRRHAITAAATAGAVGRWVTTTTQYRGATHLPIPGESTPAAGLVIVPGRDTHRYTGLWSLIHAASGVGVAAIGVPLIYARETAARLADAEVDWTLSAQQLKAHQAARTAYGAVFFELHGAWEEGRPLWWARESWRQTTAGFGLVCAAPLCDRHHDNPDQPAVLTDYDDDDDPAVHVEATLPDRVTAVDHARTAGWRDHDGDHWLCPACAADHTPDPDAYVGC